MEFSDIPKAVAWVLVAATFAAIFGLLVFEVSLHRNARAARRIADASDEVRS